MPAEGASTRVAPGDRRLGAVTLVDADATRELGRRLAAVLRAGDVVVLTGPLGAGKTTLTQGLGDGLGVRGPVTSPTFVLSRLHPSRCGGPALVHADAYRLADLPVPAALDALDLDSALEDAVTVLEWGAGLAPALGTDYLEVVLRDAGAERSVGFEAHGARWTGPVAEQLAALLAGG